MAELHCEELFVRSCDSSHILEDTHVRSNIKMAE